MASLTNINLKSYSNIQFEIIFIKMNKNCIKIIKIKFDEYYIVKII